jgi:hypothetical protein
MFFPIVVNNGVLLDSWNTVIEEGKGVESKIYRGVEEAIRECEIPVNIKHHKIAPGWVGLVLGDWWDCMTVRGCLDKDIGTFVVHITANSVGTALVVNYFLTTRLGFWRALVEKAGYWLDGKKPPMPLTVELNVVQKEILMKGFVSVVFTALQQAVEEMLQELGCEKNPIDSKSGFVI